MKVLAWKYRGLGRTMAVRQLADLIRKLGPEVLILSKTKLDEAKFWSLMPKFHLIEYSYFVAMGRSGGFRLA